MENGVVANESVAVAANQSYSSVLVTFYVDVVVFIITLMTWILLRRYRGDRVRSENLKKEFILLADIQNESPRDPFTPLESDNKRLSMSIEKEDLSDVGSNTSDMKPVRSSTNKDPSQSLWKCLQEVYRVSKKDYKAVDIDNYFTILQNLIFMFLSMSVVGLAVNIPCNLYFGDHLYGKSTDMDTVPVASFLHRASTAYWSKGASAESLWIFSIIAVAQAAIAFYFGTVIFNKVEQATLFDRRVGMRPLARLSTRGTNADIGPVETIEYPAAFTAEPDAIVNHRVMFFTVCVEGLQSQILQDVAIRGVFESIFPDQVVTAHLILDYSPVLKLKDKLEKAEDVLRKVKDELYDEARRLDQSPLPDVMQPLEQNSQSHGTSLRAPLVAYSFNGGGGPLTANDVFSHSASRDETRQQHNNTVVGAISELENEVYRSHVNTYGETPRDDPILSIVRGLNYRQHGTSISRLAHARSNISTEEGHNLGSGVRHVPQDSAVSELAPSQYGPTIDYQSESRKRLEIKEGEVEDAKARLIRAIRIRPKQNTRKAFVTFRSTRAVRRALAFQNRQFFCDWGWRLSPAPPPEDVLWRHVHVSKRNRRYRRVIGLMFLFFIDFALTFSTVFTDWILPLAESLCKLMENHIRLVLMESRFSFNVISFVMPTLSFFINSLIMPALILVAATQTRHWKWSNLQKQILHLNAILLFLNTVILPSFGAWSIFAFADSTRKTLQTTGFASFLQELAENTLSTYRTASFAVRYLLSASFLSSASQLLQIPKLGIRGLFSTFGASPPVWNFDFGYWYAYTLSIVFVSLVFCTNMPTLLPLAACACALKYVVDKYNFCIGFWNVSNDTKGQIALESMRYLFWTIACHLTITATFSLINLNKLTVADKNLLSSDGATAHIRDQDNPSISELVGYYKTALKGFLYNFLNFIFRISHHPLGIFNLIQLSLALVLFWRYVLQWHNPYTILKRRITHLFYETRKLIRGMDIKYYRHSLAYDLGRMNFDVIKENIMIEDVIMDRQKIVKAYEPPIEKEIRDFVEAERRGQ